MLKKILASFAFVTLLGHGFLIIAGINSASVAEVSHEADTVAPRAILLHTVTIRNIVFPIEIADTPQAQAHGLSDRDHLDSGSGMLFVFGVPALQQFWMKDIRCPLDFVWIKGDTVVGVTENAPPEGSVPTHIYSSPEPVDKVFEINASEAQQFGIKAGDTVDFSF